MVPEHPGWDRLLDTLSETAELHAPTEWVVTFLDENMGRLHFASTGGNTVSEALEAFAAVMSSRACHRCYRRCEIVGEQSVRKCSYRGVRKGRSWAVRPRRRRFFNRMRKKIP